MLMLQKLRKLRTNENVLIAVDVLLHSKSAFMNVFLMAFMIRSSLKDSPVSFLVFCIIRYALIGVFSIALLRLIRKHTLSAWRASMFFSVFQIIGVMVLNSRAAYFPFVMAVFAACESVLYWRPKMYYDTTEVTDDRRLRFKSLGQILIEIAKISVPVILGIIISSSSYRHTANIVLIISLFQLFLSILFRPTKKPQVKARDHSLFDVMRYMLKHASMRRAVYLSLLRGTLISSAAYLMIAQINVYRSTNSDLDLGIYTALASLVAITILWVYRHLEHKKEAQKTVLFSLTPPVILLPIAAIILPGNPVIAIALYVYTQAVIESFFNSTLTVLRLQDILSRHLKDDSYEIEIDSITGVFLAIGRVVTISVALALVMTGLDNLLMPFALLTSFSIFPILYLALPSRMWRRDKIEA